MTVTSNPLVRDNPVAFAKGLIDRQFGAFHPEEWRLKQGKTSPRRAYVTGYNSSLPRHFEHDCDACIPLGDFDNGEGKVFDLYFCGQLGGDYPTVVARYSSDGPDYRSGYEFAKRSQELGEAARRAEQAGLHVTPIECEYDYQQDGDRVGSSFYWHCSNNAVVSSLCCRQNFCLEHEEAHNEQGCNHS